jgi:hypothetical protein
MGLGVGEHASKIAYHAGSIPAMRVGGGESKWALGERPTIAVENGGESGVCSRNIHRRASAGSMRTVLRAVVIGRKINGAYRSPRSPVPPSSNVATPKTEHGAIVQFGTLRKVWPLAAPVGRSPSKYERIA